MFQASAVSSKKLWVVVEEIKASSVLRIHIVLPYQEMLYNWNKYAGLSFNWYIPADTLATNTLILRTLGRAQANTFMCLICEGKYLY
jgi:hypothetical protein